MLALRRAAWPLQRALLRSARFDAMCLELDGTEAELTLLAERLVADLYSAIPAASRSADRRRLLALKRAVFNHRSLANTKALQLPNAGLPTALSRDLACYEELQQRLVTLPDQCRGVVLGQVRSALDERVSAEDFRLALRASSPTLSAALERSGGTTASLSARDCRSLYAYICRFSSKANPLHLFSYFIPGPAMARAAATGAKHVGRYEILFDIDAVLSIEQRLLAHRVGLSRARLAIRPMVRKKGRWQLWLERKGELCTAFLPDAPLLQRLHALYAQRRNSGLAPSFTRSELEEGLADLGNPEAPDGVAGVIETLLAHGVLEPYLIEDLKSPASDLHLIDMAADPLVDCLGRWQLMRVDLAALSRIDTELATALSDDGRWPEVRYLVNSYSEDDLTEVQTAATEVLEPLRDLKCLLVAEGNFSPQQRVIRAFFKEQLREQERRPYLDLLEIFLRQRADILKRFNWGRDAREYELLSRRFETLHGELDRDSVIELKRIVSASAIPSVCCVGPFDFVQRRFFLTNLFAGDQSSVSRYLLDRAVCAANLRERADSLDVELVVPSKHNLNVVVRRFDVGLGFESRWAHGYGRWIEPTEIEVCMTESQPIYIHAPTGQRVKFHYRGLLQAQFLPVEYQLLLTEHTANYRNPFATDPPAATSSDVAYRGGLSYGPVCLRRDEWCVPTSALEALFRNTNSVAAAAALRKWVRTRVADHELWFYRVPRAGSRGRKPRLLDLGNPLSALAFRRALAGDASHVVLSRMEPNTAGLWQLDGEGYAIELMLEI